MKLDDEVINKVELAIQLLIESKPDDAKKILFRLDVEQIFDRRNFRIQQSSGVMAPAKTVSSTKRGGVPKLVLERVFSRSSYTCIYCSRRTITTDILKELSRLLPEAIKYRSNWSPKEDHALFWVYSASLEHRKPVSLGGADDEENMSVACYECNSIKSDRTIEQLGWTYEEVNSDWLGLTNYYNELKKLPSGEFVDNSIKPTQEKAAQKKAVTRVLDTVDPKLLRVGDFVRLVLPEKRSKRTYKVDSIDRSMLLLTEVWHESDSRELVYSKVSHSLEIDELGVVALVIK